MVLPPYKGSVFRGALGNAFRKVVCPEPRGICARCPVGAQCLYARFLEPSPPASYPDASRFRQAPPPYVLNPPLTNRRAFHPGDLIEFDLVLIGDAIDAVAYFIYAFLEVGRRGLGIERGKYRLLRVDRIDDGDSVTIYDGELETSGSLSAAKKPPRPCEESQPESVMLHFLTPLRLKEKGKLVTDLTFSLFFDRLVQRIGLISCLYGMGKRLPDCNTLQILAQEIQINNDGLRWYDWERYSRRQNESMKFGGLRGRFGLVGKLGPFMPLLRLGEQINVGQGTTFGLGRYEIVC